MIHEALKHKEALEAAYKHASDTLQAFPRLGNGLTPDSVRALPEWQEAKQKYNHAFENLRNFNAQFMKQYAKEYRDHIKTQRKKG